MVLALLAFLTCGYAGVVVSRWQPEVLNARPTVLGHRPRANNGIPK
jgi:hypothetical protein